MTGIIYKSTNMITNVSYIGKTTQPFNKRKNGHLFDALKCRDKSYFHNAIRLYGYENFKWEILCECDNYLLLNIRETMKIIVEHTHVSEGGYNLTWGGEGIHGYKHTIIAKQKLSEFNKNKILTDEHKTHISKGRKGMVFSNTHKENLGEANKGRVVLESTKDKISKNLTKYPFEIIKKSIELRKTGMMFKDISLIISVPVDTLKGWWYKQDKILYIWQ